MKNRTIQWINIVKRNQSLLFVSFITKADNYKYCKKFGIDYSLRDYKYIDGIVSYSKRDMDALFKIFSDKLYTEEGFLNSFSKSCYNQCDILIRKAKEISNLSDLNDFPTEELKKIFIDYAEKAFGLLPFLYGANVIEINLEQEISNGIKKLLSKEEELDLYLPSLIIPSKENVIVTEMNELLKIGCQIQQEPKLVKIFNKPSKEIELYLFGNDKSLYEKLLSHAMEFGWLHHYSGYLGNPMTVADIIDRIKIWIKRDCKKEIKRRDEQKEEREKVFKKIVKKLSIKGNFLETIMEARKFIDVRMHRINAYFIAHFYINNLLAAVSERLCVTDNELLFMTYDEIVECLEGQFKPNLKEISERKKEFGIVMIDGNREILYGKDLSEIKDAKNKEDHAKVTQLEGSTASTGEALAKSKILLDVYSNDKVNDGDIVVSPMTSPDLMPALEKASGIICDEGGILSHAAIVSRELGIPCILATQIGTRVVKDGETVQMIANIPKGLVNLVDRRV